MVYKNVTLSGQNIEKAFSSFTVMHLFENMKIVFSHEHLLCSVRLGNPNNGQGLPNLEGHVLYHHVLCRQRLQVSDTVRYCAVIRLDFTRSNYYCSHWRKKKKHHQQ